eukprot:TRINITY_DN96387_c0_g1_i1.p1 TRINITY_DN96387_c0_g1~~TRINITY_DN96387_c0_g1_i1.p1  ORF type:complete len:138 (+),score=8.08 TRINITY_DN96387_c0_g1_i1:103-516(+)
MCLDILCQGLCNGICKNVNCEPCCWPCVACCGKRGAEIFGSTLVYLALLGGWIAGRMFSPPIADEDRPSASSCMVTSQRGCFYDPFSDTVLGWTLYLFVLCVLLGIGAYGVSRLMQKRSEYDEQVEMEDGTGSSASE